jgi:hypothetical protein
VVCFYNAEGKIVSTRTVFETLIGIFRIREEDVVEEDRTPEEEEEVEGHALAHDPGPLDPGTLAKDDEDVEAHALRDPGPMDPGPMRSDEDEDPGVI